MSLPEFIFERVTADIRGHMDGVLALTEQLGRQRLTPDGEACVASVAEAAEGVRRLLDATLDLNALASDDLSLELAPVRLRELVDDVHERWNAKAAALGVTLLVSYDGDPEAAALADRRRLIQMFDGFIGGAIGLGARGAVEVSMSARTVDDGVALEGRVRGPRRAFDEQDQQTRLRSIADTLGIEAALGSMLSKRILVGLGGELRREANAGASDTAAFKILLAPISETASEPTHDAGRAAHILVVDDNATNRMVAQSLVEMFDCTSEAAEDGEEAVEAAQTGRFDLILMDIKMPRMDGVAATRAIRALPGRIGATPIIALTANADPSDVDSYVAAGMNGVVEKPMKPEHLLAALQQALSGDQQEAAA
jgi:CheY-like chemotaxis protein